VVRPLALRRVLQPQHAETLYFGEERGSVIDDSGWCEGYEDGIQAGAAVAFGLMGMAEAIRVRPRYRWKLVYWFKERGGTHSVSWYPSEDAAHDAASKFVFRGQFEIVKEEVERCGYDY
jgi:hypothetical protein